MFGQVQIELGFRLGAFALGLLRRHRFFQCPPLLQQDETDAAQQDGSGRTEQQALQERHTALTLALGVASAAIVGQRIAART